MLTYTHHWIVALHAMQYLFSWNRDIHCRVTASVAHRGLPSAIILRSDVFSCTGSGVDIRTNLIQTFIGLLQGSVEEAVNHAFVDIVLYAYTEVLQLCSIHKPLVQQRIALG